MKWILISRIEEMKTLFKRNQNLCHSLELVRNWESKTYLSSSLSIFFSSITPEVVQSTASASQATPTGSTPTPSVSIDTSQPVTSVQIRLADGTRSDLIH